ncbi:O-antigen ligase family protein [Paraburkholderia sprentiae WSM5005]|uniref:O-antigen ligase family protein n=1 Tax=Paraburkholderia sprentiae WSM5005 TaxID=754502 RepID=A0A1I9YHC0_9BURK|nr:O-antigen ligase family protein [Paraburkholderia sprentiae]APA85703.1 O-antigen ligase family protein [Paraburkholderia sprentiae WSM5005]
MIATIAYLLAVVLCATRGVLEYLIGKDAAYLVQVGGIVGLLIWYISPTAIAAYFRDEGRWSFGFLAGMLFSIGLSIVATLELTDQLGPSYLFVFIFTLFIYFYAISNYQKRFVRPRIAYAGLVLIALIEAGVALAQQQNVFPIDLPGATYGFDNLRAPSLTGSYLHYPLFVAIAASLCGVDYLVRKNVLSGLACAVLSFAIFSALSRSGMLIILGTFGLAFVQGPIQFITRNAKLIVATVFATMAIMIFGVALSSQNDSVFNVGTQRMMGATDLQSDGNDGRAEAWDKAESLASPVNVITGTYFGLVTNSAPDPVKQEFGIVESSVLQQILNIGLMGAIFYYGVLVSVTKLTSSASRISLCVWAALFQTFFYQSIEVIPFVFILMTLPVFDYVGGPRRNST